MMSTTQTSPRVAMESQPTSGEFLTLDGERYYAIRNYDAMPVFFSSIISGSDHWLFVSSSGGLTAGRVSPDQALFPYITVDRIHESAPHTGSKTVILVGPDEQAQLWEPFNREHDDRFRLTRNLYKSTLGDKIRFEEINHDLQMVFSYQWSTSDSYGFIRECALENLGEEPVALRLIDGLQNLLPAGTPKNAQDLTSNLVDAYKWSELDEASGLGIYCLYSGISDRAEPCESLRATSAFCLGIEPQGVLLSIKQLNRFRRGEAIGPEHQTRGIRGAYLVHSRELLAPKGSRSWQIVCGMEHSQGDIVALQKKIGNPTQLSADIQRSVEEGSAELARIMASSDGFQATAEENVSVHHYANVLFNVLRGGIYDDQYNINTKDLRASIRQFNQPVYLRNQAFLEALPRTVRLDELSSAVQTLADSQLERLCYEYLPITFGRRHGDPSRPWNRFSIKLKDKDGQKLLSYEGNWRDIFQNWEALTLSYPEFIEGIIAKFVNASTMDGYNPYRITNLGIDWEIEDPEDPWSYIGYWGDHQIIYLQKLLELSRSFHPQRLREWLYKRVFCYANVPYRIKSFTELLKDSKNTVTYDTAGAERIEERVQEIGADGKLVLDQHHDVRLVCLMEKLLVPLLGKLGNLVVDGGIWLNTQRPEWNDANNALVGSGLSMVTLYYLRRYMVMLQELLGEASDDFEVSAEVGSWAKATAAVLAQHMDEISAAPVSAETRFAVLTGLGSAASDYRDAVYGPMPLGERVNMPPRELKELLARALLVTDLSIERNRRDDGLFHAYNLLHLNGSSATVENLYLMLEGQVSVLSSGALSLEDSAKAIESLFESNIFRADQKSFMLYPDRPLPGFLEKNQISSESVHAIALLRNMLEKDDQRLVYRDAAGTCRFSADFSNAGDLRARLEELAAELGSASVNADRAAIEGLYESTFDHHAFTGRSGGMFGFEGLGCIYWHMVSKLLVAVQENYFRAVDSAADEALRKQLGALYYRVREGIGFNKTPGEFGAFPMDPYSHTPGHAGARQPGMTGQAKEEVLTRFGELGVRVRNGEVGLLPSLLHKREFLRESRQFHYLDVKGAWQVIELDEGSLAFTWCQVLFVYQLGQQDGPSLRIQRAGGEEQSLPGQLLPEPVSREIFARSGDVRQITLRLSRSDIFSD